MKVFYLLMFLLLFETGFTQNLKPTPVPSQLIDGRFYIKIVTAKGDTLLGLCDSGGGYNAIYSSVLKRSDLVSKIDTAQLDSQKFAYIFFSDLTKAHTPSPEVPPGYLNVIKFPFLNVQEENAETIFLRRLIPHDIFLGQFYFKGKAWTFDYAKGIIQVNTPVSITKNVNIQHLGFKKSTEGRQLYAHASMQIQVDGQAIDVLFDTGASILINKRTQDSLQNTTTSMAGSFIAKSIFTQWHKKHPEWPCIIHGELSGASLIQVPEVTIGTSKAGPVWFAVRPDEVWSKGMIKTMDKVVKGAAGGSLFQYFKVIVDYPNELISFERNK
jgi:hypothetical protein